MANAKEFIEELKLNVHQSSASHKDEVAVAQALMNDPAYTVQEYSKNGVVETTPFADLRKVFANVVSSTTKMSHKESEELMNSYEFNKSDADAFVKASKEFVQTYLQTGRKFPLGGRETSDVSLMWRNIEEKKAAVPVRYGGERVEKTIPAHGGVKAINTCPSWGVSK